MTSLPSNETLRAALEIYSDSLKLKASRVKQSSDLIELDLWYRTTLLAAIESRKITNTVHLTAEELAKLMRWKLARGKWRPSLQKFIESNPVALIISTTTTAYPQDPAVAIKTLCLLKGVGPATASAILSLFHPTTQPFFSDEGVEATLGSKAKGDYTVKIFNAYRIGMEERVREGDWSGMEELERACWSWSVQQKFGGEEEKVKKVVKKVIKRKVEEEDSLSEADTAPKKKAAVRKTASARKTKT